MISILIFLTLICQILNEGYYYKYDLQKGKEKYFATLKKGNTYYFYIKAEEGNELEIILSMDILLAVYMLMNIRQDIVQVNYTMQVFTFQVLIEMVKQFFQLLILFGILMQNM